MLKLLMMKDKKIYVLIIIYILAILLTFPILSRVSSHPDEHQFYFNAFKIMAGEELHNYLHIATTEYALTGFLYIINLFTISGINFPQGDPTAVTFYYGKILGFILYILTAILGGIILQRKDKKLKLRTIIFTLLFFCSIAMFERFIRINSDSFTIFIFLCFVIMSFWQHSQKASVAEMFLLNLMFIFLSSFTNLKALFIIIPLVILNTISPFVWYEKTKPYHGQRLPKLFRLILYGVGIIAGCLILWATLAPKPFNNIKFWYGMKKTIVHGTQFDFDYPSQSHNSATVYAYDLLAYQINTYTLVSILILCITAYAIKKRELFKNFKRIILSQINIANFKEGNFYNMTELILLACFLSYYFGISSRVIHWSRWGAPLGILIIMILSTFIEKLLENIFDQNWRKRNICLYCLLFLSFGYWCQELH
ncbi:MAG: hypothetical protein ABIB98_03580 [bacterium]